MKLTEPTAARLYLNTSITMTTLACVCVGGWVDRLIRKSVGNISIVHVNRRERNGSSWMASLSFTVMIPYQGK